MKETQEHKQNYKPCYLILTEDIIQTKLSKKTLLVLIIILEKSLRICKLINFIKNLLFWISFTVVIKSDYESKP